MVTYPLTHHRSGIYIPPPPHSHFYAVFFIMLPLNLISKQCPDSQAEEAAMPEGVPPAVDLVDIADILVDLLDAVERLVAHADRAHADSSTE